MARTFNITTDFLSSTSVVAPNTSATGNTGSVSLWYKPNWNAGDSARHFVFSIYASASTAQRVELEHFTDNNFYFGVFDHTGSTGRVVFADTGTTAGTWYNFVVTWTIDTGSTAYVNGVSKGTATPTTTNQTIDRLAVGLDVVSGSVLTANGDIADFAYWGVVLSTGEISALANGARPKDIRPSSLQGYFPITGIQSPEPDLSRSNKNLTINGAPPNASGPPVMQFTPRWPLNAPFGASAVSTGVSFQPAWAMKSRIVVDGIGI